MIRTCVITIILFALLASTGMYIYSELTGKSNCMITYVEEHYPNGSIYLIANKYRHVDVKGMESYKGIVKLGDVKGCFFSDGVGSFLYNGAYCQYIRFITYVRNIF